MVYHRPVITEILANQKCLCFEWKVTLLTFKFANLLSPGFELKLILHDPNFVHLSVADMEERIDEEIEKLVQIYDEQKEKE